MKGTKDCATGSVADCTAMVKRNVRPQRDTFQRTSKVLLLLIWKSGKTLAELQVLSPIALRMAQLVASLRHLYKSVDMTNATVGNIKNGVTLGGCHRQYPNATYKLPVLAVRQILTRQHLMPKLNQPRRLNTGTLVVLVRLAQEMLILQLRISKTESIFWHDRKLICICTQCMGFKSWCNGGRHDWETSSQLP